ncbi:MAG: hypothetical protein EBR88_08935 [Betaproteobacteria bacterium]|nr:hypothetical protein [Betaproteobacteria bacterium]
MAAQVFREQPSPRLTDKTYIAYSTWARSFEFWARPLGLWEFYISHVESPVAAGFSDEKLQKHMHDMQEYSNAVIRAFGELLQSVPLDEHA